jgi:avirulence protein
MGCISSKPQSPGSNRPPTMGTGMPDGPPSGPADTAVPGAVMRLRRDSPLAALSPRAAPATQASSFIPHSPRTTLPTQARLSAPMAPRQAAPSRLRPSMEGASTRHLPSPRAVVSKLPVQAQQRVGVARWPDAKYNKEESTAQQAYGRRFSQHCVKLGNDISAKEISDVDALWIGCQEWRKAEAENGPAGQKADFGESRYRDGMNEPLFSPLAGRYEYMNQRSVQAIGDAENSPQSGIARSDIEDSGIGYKTAIFQCHAEVGKHRRKIPVTQMEAYYHEGPDGRLKPFSINPRDRAISGQMCHTEPQHIQALMDEADVVFRSTLQDAGKLSPGEKTERLGKLHWLLAQAAPDSRGSAAKSEMAVRSLACALDMELPPFKRGVIPDLEAFVTPQDAFTQKYNGFLEKT